MRICRDKKEVCFPYLSSKNISVIKAGEVDSLKHMVGVVSFCISIFRFYRQFKRANHIVIPLFSFNLFDILNLYSVYCFSKLVSFSLNVEVKMNCRLTC